MKRKIFKNFKRRYLYFAIIIFISIVATSMSAGKTDERLPEIEDTAKNLTVIEKDEPEPEQTIQVKEIEETTPPKEFIPIFPTGGKIIKEFSDGQLVYSNTLKDYRVHNGIDIAGKILEKVCAVEDGIIKSIKNDSLMGIRIVIDHQNGVETIYSNLSSMDMVKEGDLVKKGDIISGIGDTSLIETGEETHLHFEMKVDNNYVNPLDYII